MTVKVRSDTTIVEFFGFPGVGKTTVHDILCSMLVDRGYDVVTTSEVKDWVKSHSRRYKVCLALAKPLWPFKRLMYITKYSGIEPLMSMAGWERVWSCISKELYLSEYVSTRRPTFVLLDQWSLQAAWSVGVGIHTPGHAGVGKVVEQSDYYMPKAYVYLDADLDTISSRIGARVRGGSRFDCCEAAEIKKALSAEAGLMSEILNAVQLRKFNLMMVDGLEEPAKIAEAIFQWLTACSNRQGVSRYDTTGRAQRRS